MKQKLPVILDIIGIIAALGVAGALIYIGRADERICATERRVGALEPKVMKIERVEAKQDMLIHEVTEIKTDIKTLLRR